MTELARPVDRDDWNQHWRDYATAAERNPAQRYRRVIIGKLLERFGCTGRARILDVGSGQGDLARDLHRLFPEAEIAGIELSSAGVDMASRKVPSARFFQCDLLQKDQSAGPIRAWAQYAVCSEVLEHVDDPGLLLARASEYLAPGATLVVTVPGGPKSEFDRYIGHRLHYSPASLRELLESQGLEVELATTAGFPFFNLYRLAVILRGKQLIADVDGRSTRLQGNLGSAVIALFELLFAFNLLGSSLGWQTLAVAKLNRRISATQT